MLREFWPAVVFLLVAGGLFLLAWCLACRREGGSAGPRVSLLLLVRNQAAVIEGIVRQLLAYRHWWGASFELVVVEGESGDETPAILQRLNLKQHFKLISVGGFPGEQWLELGLNSCRGRVVYCFDLREEVDPQLVTGLAGHLVMQEVLPSRDGSYCPVSGGWAG